MLIWTVKRTVEHMYKYYYGNRREKQKGGGGEKRNTGGETLKEAKTQKTGSKKINKGLKCNNSSCQ